MKFAFVLAVVLVALTAGCVEAPEPPSHGDGGRLLKLTPGDHSAKWEHAGPFQQIGVLVDTSATRLEARVDGGEWRPVEITWDEGQHKVGRVVLDAEATSLELRANAPWTFGTVQLFDDVEASGVLTRDLPVARSELTLAAFGPSSMVVSRAQWGARSPNRVCGSWHNPDRISIHHTDIPADDGGDPAARLRQMQAYHIDNRGWCDIGYHFVVSQSGRIYQGRNEERTGAHVDDRNTGNVGISFIGNFDRQTMNPTQFAAGARILGWVARTYGIPFNRSAILGHRENPGQSTDCPGANLLGRLGELIALARDGGSTVAPPARTAASSFEVNWRSNETDMFPAGSSRGVPDAFPGEWMRAEITFKNTTTVPLRGVQFGYDMGHLEPVEYVIESDAPRFDGTSFRANDANSNPQNPSELGRSGTLGLYAFSPGETKRVVIDFNAGDYSIGSAQRAGLRAWVRHIDGVYEQRAYGATATSNLFTQRLQDAAQVDVYSPMEWQFDGGEAVQLEGWSGCSGTMATVDAMAGTLVAQVGEGKCLESPAWTSIDADEWGQIVLRMSVVGSHTAALYWRDEGERFAAHRAVTFEVDNGENTYVLDLGAHPEWSGEATRLLLVPSTGRATTASVDALFLQSAGGRSASTRERFVTGASVSWSPRAPEPPTAADGRADSLGGSVEQPSPMTEPQGCSTGAGSASSGVPLLLFVLVFIRRRRRSTAYFVWPGSISTATIGGWYI